MRAVVVDDANKAKASALSISNIDRPKIEKPHQAMVKVKAFGLNRSMRHMSGDFLIPVHIC